MASMKIGNLGLPTFNSRVERWECDTNNHWNTRFYARAFQMASEGISHDAQTCSMGASSVSSRHMRFYKELMAGATVEITSLLVRGGDFDGKVLHQLLSGGELSATALDSPSISLCELPEIEHDKLTYALPRGIRSPFQGSQVEPAAVELGPVRPYDCDHKGMLLFENIVRLVVMGSQKKMYQIGFTPDFITASGISRMAVEFQVDLHSQCEAGSLLRAQSSLASVSKKTFNISHRLHTRAGKLIATGEQCLIAVDLAARRAVDVPEFIRRAI